MMICRFTPRYMYDKIVLPNFLAGGAGYIFTMDTAAKLYNASMEVPLYIFEDVYITGKFILFLREMINNFIINLCIGIVAEKAQIQPKNFHLFNFGHYKDMCEFRGLITHHQTEPYIQKIVYDFIINSDEECPAPRRNVAVQLPNDTNEKCSNQYTFGQPKGVCASDFYNLLN